MTEPLLQFLREFVSVFLDAAPYILLGFVVAAVIQVLLPVSLVQKLFGRGKVRSIFAAATLGIPLPLCSCSVLPTAIALRRRGAGKGATASFLVATPETGVDSIALTYGLMDPIMTVFRPLAAMVTAVTAGFAVEAFGGKDKTQTDEEKAAADAEVAEAAEMAKAAKGSAYDALEKEELVADEMAGLTFTQKLRRGFRGAFVELFDETAHWMLAGLVISAFIAVVLPAEIVTRYLSSGAIPILLMLFIGIPLYICASASTPIAAALVLKGLSPGAALVFLLAGPATNVGSLAILRRFLGTRIVTIYLLTIAVLSVALGVLLDGIYAASGIDAAAIASETELLPLWVSVPSAVVFAGLLLISFRRAPAPPEFQAVGRFFERILGFRFTGRLFARLGLAATAVWLVAQCVTIVPPGHRGLITAFGAPAGGARAPGLHVHWPPPIGNAQVVSADGVRRLEIGFRTAPAVTASAAPRAQDLRVLEEESMFLTGDENLIALKCALQFRVTDPERYVWDFDDPESVLRLETIAELLDVIGAFEIDALYTTRRPVVEQAVEEGVRERATRIDLGIEVLGFQIRDVHAPPEVHAAFRDVASAQEDKQTNINQAWRYRDETVTLARGEAARQHEVARSDSLSAVWGAEGESQSLLLQSEAYARSPSGTRNRLYLETVEEVLSRGRKIVRPGWDGSGSIDLWISTGQGGPAPVGEVLRGGDIRRGQRSGE